MTSHENCSHPKTKAARAACRRDQAAITKRNDAERARIAAMPFHERMNRAYRVEDLNEYAFDQEGIFQGTCEYCESQTNVVATKQKMNMCGGCVRHVNKHLAQIDPIHHWTGEALSPKTVEDVMIESGEL